MLTLCCTIIVSKSLLAVDMYRAVLHLNKVFTPPTSSHIWGNIYAHTGHLTCFPIHPNTAHPFNYNTGVSSYSSNNRSSTTLLLRPMWLENKLWFFIINMSYIVCIWRFAPEICTTKSDENPREVPARYNNIKPYLSDTLGVTPSNWWRNTAVCNSILILVYPI